MTQGTKKKAVLTALEVSALRLGEWLSDQTPKGAGRLQVRRLASGQLSWYYRYSAPDGKRVRLPLGTGLDLAEARAAADELKRRYQAGERDLRGALEAERRERARQREAERRAAEAEAARARATLGVLLEGYVEHLRRAGKASARAVENCIRRHVQRPWPKLWNTPAADVALDDVLEVVALVASSGHLREAAKLRAYLRAAYATAIKARQDPLGLPELRALQIRSNPARDLATIEGATNPRERALSLAELRAYWRRIRDDASPAGAVLRFHLWTGGQRIVQLARLTVNDLDRGAGTVRIRDGKGRRKVARPHDVPLIPAAEEALRVMRAGEAGQYIFTLDAGQTPVSYSSLRDRLRHVVADMAEAGELEGGPFTLGDLRRTIETRLAAAGVPKDIRGRLQSHGVSGIQDRHYDRHEYIEEKRAALEMLHRLVTGEGATVTPIRRAATAV